MSLEYPGHEEAMILEEILRKRIKENARLREALEFYADKDNYFARPFVDDYYKDCKQLYVNIDKGAKAREALAQISS